MAPFTQKCFADYATKTTFHWHEAEEMKMEF